MLFFTSVTLLLAVLIAPHATAEVQLVGGFTHNGLYS
jgi:hypothetical protein